MSDHISAEKPLVFLAQSLPRIDKASEQQMDDNEADRIVGADGERSHRKPKHTRAKKRQHRRRPVEYTPSPEGTSWVAIAAVTAAIGVVGLCGYFVSRTPSHAPTQVATLRSCAPRSLILRNERRMMLRPNTPILEGDLLTVMDDDAVIGYADGTTVILRPGANAAFHISRGAKHVLLRHGKLKAHIMAQGVPMVIATPHAHATTMEAKLTAHVDAIQTSLRVTEGRVRFRKTNRSSIPVGAGQQIDSRAMKLQPIQQIWHALPITEDLTGWYVLSGDWQTANGELIGTEHDGPPQIRTEAAYDDFEMVCRMRVDQKRTAHIQIRDAAWQFTIDVQDDPMAWREIRVLAQDHDVMCWVDGKQIDPTPNGAKSGTRKGSIGFGAPQGSTFRIRNVRIRTVE